MSLGLKMALLEVLVPASVAICPGTLNAISEPRVEGPRISRVLREGLDGGNAGSRDARFGRVE